MKTLLTGSQGFIGKHLMKELRNVKTYDIKDGQDIRDHKKIFEAMKGIEEVYHFAALADIDKAWYKPSKTVIMNVVGTCNVLEAARLNGVKRFIFASSLYADSDKGGLYGATKNMGELLVKSYSQYCGMEYVILRFGTIYGPQSGEDNSIRRLLKQALTRRINYHGTGDEVREYIHVRDVARIIANLNDYRNDTLMITGSQRIKLKDVLSMIEEITETKVKYSQKKSLSHYNQVSQSYKREPIRRVFPKEPEDFGNSLVEILEEIDG